MPKALLLREVLAELRKPGRTRHPRQAVAGSFTTLRPVGHRSVTRTQESGTIEEGLDQHSSGAVTQSKQEMPPRVGKELQKHVLTSFLFRRLLGLPLAKPTWKPGGRGAVMITRGQCPRPKTETILKNESDGGERGEMEKSQHKTNNSRIRIGDLASFELPQLIDTQNFYGLNSKRVGMRVFSYVYLFYITVFFPVPFSC